MGKHRRQRRKLHLPAQAKVEETKNDNPDNTMDTSQPILLQPSENLFAGININLDNLKKDLDDARSIKSFKSLKSDAGDNKVMSKKDKLKLRKEILLKKIDTVRQMKLESKRRNKRKNVSIIGDTNPLHDALPSLQSLLASRSHNSVRKTEERTRRKGIEKASKRKKQVVQGVQLFKKLLADKKFQQDPLKTITERVQAVVEQEKMKIY